MACQSTDSLVTIPTTPATDSENGTSTPLPDYDMVCKDNQKSSKGEDVLGQYCRRKPMMIFVGALAVC